MLCNRYQCSEGHNKMINQDDPDDDDEEEEEEGEKDFDDEDHDEDGDDMLLLMMMYMNEYQMCAILPTIRCDAVAPREGK